MATIIQSVRIRPDRAERLREKAIELTIEKKEHIKETDLINYLIDECLDEISIDDLGLKMKK